MNPANILASFASAFSQDQRLLTLALTGGDIRAEQLLPHSLEWDEAISGFYSGRLVCVAPDSHIPLKSLLGLAVRVGILDAAGHQAVRCGTVSRAEWLGSDGGFAHYALTIEAPVALLRHRRTSRVFQDQSVPDIVGQIIAEHQAANPVFARIQTLAFNVRPAQPRSYCLQYRESDADFVTRLLAEEGYAWRFVHHDGDTPQVEMQVFDDPFSLPQAGIGRVRFHRSDATEAEDGLTEWCARREIRPASSHLASFDYQPVATLTAQDETRIDQGDGGNALSASLHDYDPQSLYYAPDNAGLAHYAQLRQQAHDRETKQFAGSGSVRGLEAGVWFVLDEHPAHAADADADREFVMTRQRLRARNNLPADIAGSGVHKDDAPFVTEFDAQRRGIPLTPAYQPKPGSQGAQTATVVGPAGEEIHTDALGRIRIQFHWQRPDEHPQLGANMDERSSCWLRVALPSAGAGFGHQFIPRIGQEVLVTFLENDIDRPLITGVLYNGSHTPPQFSGAGALPANKSLSGIKSKELQGGQYNELLFDDTPGQVRAKLSSEAGKTQLNQGYLTHPRQNGKAEARGEGFELRTDQHGALRAAHGLFISTEAQNGAGGKQLARDHAQSQLESALALSQSLAETATAQLADTLETGPEAISPDNTAQGKKPTGHLQHQVDALRAWEAGSNTDPDGKTAQGQSGQQPLLILSAPAGIASLTEQSQTLSAGANLNLVTHRDTNHTTGRRWLHNVGQHISLFVAGVKDKVAIKLIAAKGKVQVQAQGGEMEFTADQDVSITSTKNRITAAAKEEIVLTAGGGYIRLKGGNIEIHCPGTVSFKGAKHGFGGGTSMEAKFPLLPSTEFSMKHSLRFAFAHADELAPQAGFAGKPYSITDSQGKTLASGTVPKSGRLPRIMLDEADRLQLTIGSEGWKVEELPIREAETSSAPMAEADDSDFLTTEQIRAFMGTVSKG